MLTINDLQVADTVRRAKEHKSPEAWLSFFRTAVSLQQLDRPGREEDRSEFAARCGYAALPLLGIGKVVG